MCIWRRLTEPQAALQDRQHRSQARILTAVHLPLLAVSLYFVLVPGHGLQRTSRYSLPIDLALLAATFCTYIVSRTPRYRLAAAVLVSAQVTYVLASLAVDPQQETIQLLPLFLNLPILFSSIFLPPIASLVLLAMITGGLLLMPNLSSAVTPRAVVDYLHYVGVFSPFILLIAYLREHDQRAIHAHAHALEESQARYRLLFEESFEPLLIVADGEVLDANPAFERLTGNATSALLGQAEASLIRRQPIDGGEEVGAWLRRWDGVELPVEIKEKPAFYRNRPVRLISLRDLTLQLEGQRQQLELALERSQRSILQKLIRNLSHDLRTPLAVIKTSLYLVERSVDSLEKQQKHIDVVRGQINRLQEMMDDVILLARLESESESAVLFEPVDLDDLVTRIVQEYAPLAAKRGLELHFPASMSLPTIDGDENGLARVLRRLLTNAVNYTPQGGRIVVTTAADDENVAIRIEDTGIGISPDDLPHIFDHFFRADLARSSDSGSAGLGLTVVKRLVDMHHGSVSVTSQLHVGSAFTVSLPIHQQDESQPVLA